MLPNYIHGLFIYAFFLLFFSLFIFHFVHNNNESQVKPIVQSYSYKLLYCINKIKIDSFFRIDDVDDDNHGWCGSGGGGTRVYCMQYIRVCTLREHMCD